jgi:AcrR family transcriptional regulator
VTPPSTRHPRVNRAARRVEIGDRLLASAERMLSEGEPYASITVERLARAAALTRTTFYVYFEDKAELLYAWLERIDTEIDEVSRGWWQLDGRAGRDDLRAVLAEILTVNRTYAHLMTAVYDAALFDRALDIGLRQIVDRMAGSLRDHIERGQRAGWVNPGLRAEQTASWLAWMIQRGHRRLRSLDDAALNDEVEAYTAIFWNTLYRR